MERCGRGHRRGEKMGTEEKMGTDEMDEGKDKEEGISIRGRIMHTHMLHREALTSTRRISYYMHVEARCAVAMV